MKTISMCFRTMQAALFAACLLLCTGVARGQTTTVPLDLRCPTNVTLWTCSDTAIWQSPLPVPSGGCSNYTVVCTPPVGTPLPLGVTTVTCRVFDACQNSDTCTFNITVRRDTEPPTIKCPSNIVVKVCPTAAGGCGGVVTYPPPLATDNSGSVSVVCNPPSGSFFPCGVSVVNCLAVDRCQNRDTCEFTITVEPGGQPPSIQCPPDQTILTCSNTAVLVYPVPAVIPAGTTVVCNPPSGTLLPLGSHAVVCIASNACGAAQCSFKVEVRPVPPPVITCPSNINITLPCPSNCIQVAYAPPTVVNGNLAGCSPPPGACLTPGVTTVTCFATNRCGDRDVCQFDVRVVQGQGQPPGIQCPADITVTTCSNTCQVINYPNPVVVNGVLVKCSPPSGFCFPIGTTTVICEASNACARAECTFRITVRPVPPPSISCPTNDIIVTAQCNSNCVPVTYVPPTVAGGSLVGCNPPSGACLPVGIHTVTCVATNICGDRDVCQFRIRVVPGQGPPPQILCPNDLTVTTCSNCVNVNYPLPIVNNGVLVKCSPPPTFCFPIGTTTVICEASNACSRAECTFDVVVRRVPPPSILCPSNIVVTVPCGSNCVPVVYPLPTVSNGTLIGCNPPQGTCLPVGLHPVICRATNACGERAECEFTVRVIQGQGQPPVIRCPDDITVTACSNTCQVVTYPPPTVINGVLVGCVPPSGTCFPAGVTTVNCVATNECGRSECKFTVTVKPGSPCVKPPLNMVLWLPFDEPAGFTAHNIVPGAPNGVYLNGVSPLLGQHVLNSRNFDGLNDLVRVPNYAAIQLSASDFTIDAWILVRTNTGSRTIVSKVQTPLPGTLTPTRGYEFYLKLGRLNLDLFGAVSQNFDSGVNVPMDNAWHHVAVTVRRGGGGNVRFYLDGVAVASLGGPITAPLGNSTRLQVGHTTQTGPGPMVPFSGYIDEVEIFRRALTAAEIASLWNAGTAGKCKIHCTIPWDVSYPPNQPCITVQARICNYSGVPQPVTWTASGPMPIPTPTGSFILPPFTCTNVPVVLCRPTNNLPVGAIVRWTLSVQAGTQCPVECVGSVINPGRLVVTVPNLPIAIPGTSRVDRVRVSLNGLPPGQPIRLYVVGPDMELDRTAVSLNGLPPGVPWIIDGPFSAASEDTSFEVPVRFADADPIGTYTVLIQTDVDGDEAYDTVASFDIENPVVPPPTIQIVDRDGRYFLLWEDGGDGFGILETSKEADGPWDQIPGALPAHPVSPGEAKQFFRVVVPGE